MEKIKVKTSGNFILVDPQTGYEMVEFEARSVPKTHFVIERLETKELINEGSDGEVVQSTDGSDREQADTDHNPRYKEVDTEAGTREPEFDMVTDEQKEAAKVEPETAPAPKSRRK